MDLKNSRLFQNFILVFFVLNLLVCPFMFIGSMWAHGMLKFLEPVVCPDGMEMEIYTQQETNSEGDQVMASHARCTEGNQRVDITWKMVLIMLGFPALGVVVFFFAPTAPLKKEDSIRIDPEAFE